MNAINMVNVFPRLQLSPQVFLHDFPVLGVASACYRIRLQREFRISLYI